MKGVGELKRLVLPSLFSKAMGANIYRPSKPAYFTSLTDVIVIVIIVIIINQPIIQLNNHSFVYSIVFRSLFYYSSALHGQFVLQNCMMLVEPSQTRLQSTKPYMG